MLSDAITRTLYALEDRETRRAFELMLQDPNHPVYLFYRESGPEIWGSFEAGHVAPGEDWKPCLLPKEDARIEYARVNPALNRDQIRAFIHDRLWMSPILPASVVKEESRKAPTKHKGT